MDKKAIKQIGIGFLIAIFIIKFENGLIWNGIVHIFSQVWAVIYPKISDFVAFFLMLSPYAAGFISQSEYTKWLMNMGTIATIISMIMYIRCAKSSKLHIVFKLFYYVVFFYVTWFANCIMVFFWKRIGEGRPYFALVSIALFGILLWLAGYYMFFKSLMAKEKLF